MKFCCEYSRLDLPCSCPPVRDVETTRESFEERVWIKYCSYCCKNEIDLQPKESFLERNGEGYKVEYIDTLWEGWKWCYEICKVPVK